MNTTKNNSNLPRSNNMIRSPQVRVVGDDGQQIGILSTYDAIKLAKEQGLDLVEVNGKGIPPVCKIMDFGKFKYEQKKKEKELVRNQRANTLGLKEVSVHPTTVEHDLKIKAENYIQRWLSEGNKVRINVEFRGREAARPEFGQETINFLLKFLVPSSFNIEEQPTLSGKKMSLLIVPLTPTT